MSFIEGDAMMIARLALVAIAGLGLAGCAQSVVRLSPDFGQAVRQDTAAQIADPDAKYDGTTAPGSNGARVDLAQKRYEKNQVVQPSTATASGTMSTSGGNTAGASAGTGGP
jgi:hypothetical protein